MFGKRLKNAKKWMSVFICAMALTTTACGNGTTTTSTEAAGEDTKESESIMCRVTSVGDNSLTVMTMGNGNRGERPDGTPPADRENMKDGEKPDGTPPADYKEKKEQSEDGASGDETKEDLPENAKNHGEEKTILLSDSTTIKKENEDGTIEECVLSDITEGVMLKVTGTDSENGYQAAEIVISTMQNFRGKDKSGEAGQSENGDGTQQSNDTNTEA